MKKKDEKSEDQRGGAEHELVDALQQAYALLDLVYPEVTKPQAAAIARWFPKARKALKDGGYYI